MSKYTMLDLKDEYLKIETPSENSKAIMKGIERGRQEMKTNNQSRNNVLKVCVSLVIGVLMFTGAVNVSPTFADTLKDIPILGEIVQILQFTDGKARGGEITDGTDISGIEMKEQETFEEIIIEFSNDSVDQENVGAYKVVKAKYPNTLTFEIGGARRITALEDFKILEESQYVKDIYPLITLDDSMMRFVVVLKAAVDVEITEMKTPASLIMHISEKEAGVESIKYVVRTESFQRGEAFGVLEETLSMDYETRVLKDDNDFFLIDLKSFDTKEAAEAFIAEHVHNANVKLLVEARSENDMPRYFPNKDIN